jgi:signal transduction histidine kinase
MRKQANTVYREFTLITGLVGTLVLAGWVFNEENLIYLGFFQPMAANTAFLFILSYAALRFEILKENSKYSPNAAFILTLTIGLIALISFFSHFIDFSFNIHKIFSRESTEMPLLTAFNFIIISLALFFFRTKSIFLHLLVFFVFITSLYSFSNYVFGGKEISEESFLILTTPLSSLLFLIYCLGVIFSKPEEGFMILLTADSLAGTLIRRLLPIAILLPLALGWLRIWGERLDLYDKVSGISLYSTLNIIIFSSLIIWFSSKLLREESNKRKVEESLTKSRGQIADYDNRINSIMSSLLQFASMDFSKPIAISQRRDELDALAAGLNTMAEELEAMLKTERKNIQRLKEHAEQLEFSNRELDAFTYSVSHDLRSPLRAINGFTKILAEEYKDKYDEEGKRLLNIIMTEAKRMGNLIDDLLALSRISKKGIEKNITDMTALAKSAAESFVNIPENIKIIVYDLPEAYGDATLLRQVFINLISNSIKFSKKNLPNLIEIGSKKTEAGTVYFIKDSGVGFDPAYKDKLFKTFSRLHSEQEFEGTGIGLTIVKRIIDHHEGAVWAEGMPGVGATFYFTLSKA